MHLIAFLKWSHATPLSDPCASNANLRTRKANGRLGAPAPPRSSWHLARVTARVQVHTTRLHCPASCRTEGSAYSPQAWTQSGSCAHLPTPRVARALNLSAPIWTVLSLRYMHVPSARRIRRPATSRAPAEAQAAAFALSAVSGRWYRSGDPCSQCDRALVVMTRERHTSRELDGRFETDGPTARAATAR